MAWGCPNILTQFHLSLPQPGAASHRHRPPLQHLLPRLWLRLPGCRLLQASLTHAFRHHQPGEGMPGPLGWAHWPHASLRLFACGATTPGTDRVHCLEALRGRGGLGAATWPQQCQQEACGPGSWVGSGPAHSKPEPGLRLSTRRRRLRSCRLRETDHGRSGHMPGFRLGSALTSALLPKAVPMALTPSLCQLLPVVTQTSSSVILKALPSPPPSAKSPSQQNFSKALSTPPISTSFPIHSQRKRKTSIFKILY